MVTNINLAIIRSIPLDKNLKRYFVAKWNHLCQHNGERYASDVFADLRTVLLEYRSDPKRLDRKEKYLAKLPIRKNGWAIKLLSYMDSHPSAVLSFVKLYTAMAKPLVTVEEAAQQQEDYLASRKNVVNTDVPWYLSAWLLHFVDREAPLSYKEYRALAWNTRNPSVVKDQSELTPEERISYETFGTEFLDERALHYRDINDDIIRKSGITSKERKLLKKFITWPEHNYYQYLRYWKSWHRRLRPTRMGDILADELIRTKPVLPEIYKDFVIGDQGPESMSSHEDLIEATFLWHYATGWRNLNNGVDKPSVSKDSLLLLSSVFNKEWRFPGFNGSVLPLENSYLYDEMRHYTVQHGRHSHVGHVHYIPKKGTVKRRPIAVPNRFLQQCLVPVFTHLAERVARLPRDCTFDQSRLDYKIQNRVNNDNLYIGSVDLSQATDNLPFTWGIRIMESLIHHDDVMLSRSRNLFIEMTRSSWVSRTKTRVSWDVGQPLGTLPSFMVLALTHNLFLESSAFALGISHSPYTVLGDDVTILNRKLRRHYIREMTNRGVPLSLHKSYEGNLTEFAGKIFVKNMKPFYITDHSPITVESLFDYGRATGISLKWEHLPRYLRRRLDRRFSLSDASLGGLKVSQAYNAVQSLYIPPRGSFSIRQDTSLKEIFDVFVDISDKLEPEIRDQLDLRWFSGHPIQLGPTTYIEKHGHMLSIKALELEPNWFKRKFRPVSTDKLLRAGAMALMELKHQMDTGHMSADYQKAVRSMWHGHLG